MEFLALVGIAAGALVGIWLIVRVLSIDWFGIYYDDPTSPYYHDKTGRGRGQ